MKNTHSLHALALAAAALAAAPEARADLITDWNLKSADIITDAKIGTPPAVRVMAIVQTAAQCAVNAALSDKTAAVEAALAAAHRASFARLLPAQQALTEGMVQAALAPLPEGPAKAAGLRLGEQCAAEVLARRADDGATTPETYRPHTSAGIYVPTAAAAAPQWPQRKPWLMASASAVRPPAPPALASEAWARDYNEVKLLGGRHSTQRSAEQTEVGRFWEYSLPAVYYGVLRSVALAPGRDLARNARLFAVAAQAMDDALIAVFDAKYQYHFWRPVTAVRNGDIDGNDATVRDAGWLPLVETPMHPEYPSAHSTLAATVAQLVKADIGNQPLPPLATSSPTAKGATRRWTRVEDFVQEVGDARVWAGIHFRSACDTGAAMGRRVGELAARQLQPAPQ